MSKFEQRYQIKFPRTWRGWKKLFWLTLRMCPVHHKPLAYNFPWDGPHIMYGFCCDGWSINVVGFWNCLYANWKAEQPKQPTRETYTKERA